jgi:hypothetical protein
MLETKFRTHTEPQAKLYYCIFLRLSSQIFARIMRSKFYLTPFKGIYALVRVFFESSDEM